MCVWERKKTQQDPFNNEEEKNCSNRSVLLFYDSKQSIDVWESVMNDFQNNKTWGEKKTKRERKRLFLKHTHTHTTKLELENTKLNRSTSWLVAGFFSKKNRSCRTRKRESATRKKQTHRWKTDELLIPCRIMTVGHRWMIVIGRCCQQRWSRKKRIITRCLFVSWMKFIERFEWIE